MRCVRIITFSGSLVLFLALIMPTVVMGTVVHKLWALIICGYPAYSAGEQGMRLDPRYMRDVLTAHYSFSGVRLIDDLDLAASEDKDWLRSEIRNWLGDRSDGDDLILIFIMSHGCQRNDESGDELDGIDEGIQLKEAFGDWREYEYYWDDELKEDLATLNYRRLVLLLQGCKVVNETEGCYTGGFIRDLSAPKRIIITSSNETHVSYGEELYPGDPMSIVGYFSRPFINSLNPENAAFAEADINGDGVVSMWEAFRYAYENDPAVEGFWSDGTWCQETPQLDDNGDGVADSYDGGFSYFQTFFGSERPITTDINWDGRVDVIDMAIVTKAWLTGPGDPLWNWYADMDANLFINLADVSAVAKDFGKRDITLEGTPTGTPEISVHPNEIEVTKYQAFSVDIKVTDVTDLYCYEFQLYYNTAVLNCTGVGLPPGHFLEPVDPSNIYIVTQQYDNAYNATHGRVWVAVSLMSDEPGKDGNGTLVTIDFEAIGVGSSTLHFYDTVIGDSVPEAMPVIAVDGSATVLENFPPETPSTPSGASHGYATRTYEYSTSTTDPNGDSVKYQFSWGDGTTTTGWYQSGITATASHSWVSAGTYQVKVRARDIYHDFPDNWSPSLQVTIDPPGGGSCPFIYSWDGQQYHFDHEAYPFAVMKSAETTSYDRLKYLKEVDGEYRLRIEQVLHEVAWLDSFDLYVVDHPDNDSFVMPDLEGNLHTVKELIQPVSAYEKNGEDCLEDVKYFDSRIWQDSVLDANVSDESTLRNWITLTFPKPEATTAKLLLNVKKQETITKEWEFFINAIGENYWNLWQKIAEAPVLTKLIQDTLEREIELGIEVWNGTEWTKQGSLSAGDSIWDDFLVVLDISDIQGDELQVRLKSTTGHYQINYVGIDYSEDEPMTIHKIDPYSAIKNGEEDILGALEYPDETYVTLVPNDVIELKYNAIPESEWKRDYTIATKGYYNFIDFQNRTFSEFLEGIVLWLKAMTEPYFVPKTVFPYLQENQ